MRRDAEADEQSDKEPVTGSYTPPADFHCILEHIEAGRSKTELHDLHVQTKRAWRSCGRKQGEYRREHAIIPLDEHSQMIVQDI
jgi:hypothetical protein